MLINASRWGANSRWALKHIRSDVLRHRPDVIVIEFAINDADIRHEMSIGESEKNTETMIELAIDDNVDCQIWLMTSHVPSRRHKRLRPNLTDYYDMYKVLAKRNRLGLIDLYRIWGPAPPARRYMPDGIHTNSAAAKEVILPAVLSQLVL